MDTRKTTDREHYMESQITISVVYTIMASVLIVTTLLNRAEYWTIPIILFSVVASWVLHITQFLNEKQWLWVYAVFFNVSFFYFAAIAPNWTDLTVMMLAILITFSMASSEGVINVCQIIYYVSVVLRIVKAIINSETFTGMDIARYIFHFLAVFAASFIVRHWIQNRQRNLQQTAAMLTELQVANHRTEDFLTNVSHELRTPINAVVGVSSVILREEMDDSRRSDLMAIQSAGRRLFDQIEDILDFTEIDTDRLVVSSENFAIASTLHDLVAEMRWTDKENMPEIVFDLDPRIPSILVGDERKIKKILRHLIGNAVKFTRRGGVYIKITYRDEPYGINLLITVADTGIGIEEEELGRITDKYYQSEMGRNRIAGGLGLGLSIVRGLAAAMNGFMIIRSERNRGTRVQVSIPHLVGNTAPCLTVTEQDKLCVATYLKPERYSIPEVREFYHNTFDHLISGTEFQAYRVSQLEDLKRILAAYKLSHIFINEFEYIENPEFFKSIDPSITLIIMADPSFEEPDQPNVEILRKPFSSEKLISILNISREQSKEESHKQLQMIVPGLKALVVDDEPMNLLVAQQVFRGYKMDVTTVNSGIKAIRSCEKNDYDIIFMDHMMPEMDGVEATHHIRQMETSGKRHIIVALTANAVSGAREMFLSEGLDEFISKPIETVELERVLKKVLPAGVIQWTDAPVKPAKKKLSSIVETQPAPAAPAAEAPAAEVHPVTEQPQEPAPAAETPPPVTGPAEEPVAATPSESAPVSESVGAIDSPMEYLELAGINTEAGIEYCKDEDFYLEMIAMFVESYDDKVESITDCYNKSDWENYRILVHTLKSNSRMLGAEELSALALHQEESARDLNEPEIHSKHEEMMSTFTEFTDLFRKALALSPEYAEGGEF